MRHARKDYDRIQDPDGKIPEDEPVFLLRGQDAIASATVLFWAVMAELRGADPVMVAKARECARAMRDWHIHKRPDL